MDEFGGLPYDESAIPAAAPAADSEGDHPMLDRALDDLPPRRRGSGETGEHDRGPVPEHVQSLIGRMGRGRVYLSEESTGIIHHDGQRRIQRDPRLARLAEELDKQDPTAWLAAISETSASPIRPNALFVSSTLIKHLSTSKVFTWVSELGATAMGIEWLNDETLVLLFDSAAAALLGLSMLAKAGFDPTEGDDPLLERAAYGIPHSLLPRAEPKVAEDVATAAGASVDVPSRAGEELMTGVDASTAETATEDAPIRRKGRGAFAAREPTTSAHGRFDLAPLAPTDSRTAQFAEGVDPYARVTVRYAVESDAKQRRDAGASEWYARHGRQAGKERAPRRSGGAYGGYAREGPVELKDRVGTAGEGKEFARRIGRERERPYDRPVRREGHPPRRSVMDLDADLESFAARRDGREGPEESGRGERRAGGGGRGREGNGRRPPRSNRDDLDRELENMLAGRKDS